LAARTSLSSSLLNPVFPTPFTYIPSQKFKLHKNEDEKFGGKMGFGAENALNLLYLFIPF
jgi:hypothetical protein